jgi:hypothetical protein
VGSQQLLLIIVGTIVMGIMILVGISLFIDHTSATNRDAVSNDLIHAASMAQAYQRRPVILGGGGGSFVGFDLRTAMGLSNENGSYSVFGAPTDSVLVLEGLGSQPGYDANAPVKVSVKVYSSRTVVNEVN